MSQADDAPSQDRLAAVYEVFVQVGGPGRPIQYVGSVRGVDPALAWHQAKEAYTRREECTLLWIVPREAVFSGYPSDVATLRTGTSRRYRLPAYPSSRRRTRSRLANPANGEAST